MLTYLASTVIDNIISLRMLFFLTFFKDLWMILRVYLVIHNVVEKIAGNVLLSDKWKKKGTVTDSGMSCLSTVPGNGITEPYLQKTRSLYIPSWLGSFHESRP